MKKYLIPVLATVILVSAASVHAMSFANPASSYTQLPGTPANNQYYETAPDQTNVTTGGTVTTQSTGSVPFGAPLTTSISFAPRVDQVPTMSTTTKELGWVNVYKTVDPSNGTTCYVAIAQDGTWKFACVWIVLR